MFTMIVRRFLWAMYRKCISLKSHKISLNLKALTIDWFFFMFRMVEQCHFTYVTKFKPSQEEICDENFEKKCQISFKQQAYNETVKKCYKPVRKVRNREGNFKKC